MGGDAAMTGLSVPLLAIWALVGAAGGWLSWLAAVRLTAGGRETSADRWLPVLASASGAVLLAVAAQRASGDPGQVAAVAILAAPLLVCLLTDARAMLIYPTIVVPGVVIALGVAAGASPGLASAAIGALAAAGVAAGLVVLARRCWGSDSEPPLGSGDVLIAALLGATFGLERVLAVSFTGMVLAAAIAGVLLATRHVPRGAPLPYGAVLCGTALAALVM